MATLYHQLWIDAPASRVYQALATAEGLGTWWAPHTEEKTPQGLVLSHDPGERHGEVSFLVTDLVPARRVEWEVISKHPAQSPASSWTGTRILFELSEEKSPGGWIGLEDDGRTLTKLEFHHNGWDESSPFLGFCNFAWGQVLGMLQKQCEE
ncbi:SRPBCC family protein [Luteolibacter luteus]|uniref:SRPBCC domain-containing protein n=1 Tax=Luteolibacter luteus TaxID=2728835 RepID=A0A858RKI8_9BACT|nr:SRPBCC domain-containing protein [Luteolibacter luteus]QJE97826.1 SRPBCC domain-containing protein [Luteolibacter luteus]